MKNPIKISSKNEIVVSKPDYRLHNALKRLIEYAAALEKLSEDQEKKNE